MKTHILLISLITGIATASLGQSLVLNAESGNRSTEQANCWAFGATSYSNLEFRINGNWSIRTNQLTNLSTSASWIKSPWLKPGTGSITMKTRLENDRGTSRAVVFQYVPYDASVESVHKEGKSVEFFTYKWATPLDIWVKDLTVAVPAEIANSDKPFKILISFIGEGGTSRAFADDIVIPGTYFSDPANGCLPVLKGSDKDSDGVKDEDDAYPDDKERAFNSYLPTESFNTLMFEDLWPGKGDFDFNDLVVDYQMKMVSNAKNELVDLAFTYKVKAIGAAFKNGLGVELRGIKPSQVFSVKGNSLKNGIHKIAANGLEEGTESLTFIAFDNAFDLLPYAGGGVTGVNTTVGAPAQKIRTETVVINFLQDGKSANGTPVMAKEITMDQFNPFMIVNQKRGIEIHLPDMPPTALADKSLFGTKEDASSEGSGRWYKTKNNFLPWALNVSMEVPYPIEKVSLEKAYPYFAKWAQSNGSEYADWYIEKYRENGALYK